MMVALALLLGAGVLGGLAPGRLRSLGGAGVDAAALLMAWGVAGLAVLASAITAVWILLIPGHGSQDGVQSALHGCWDALAHGTVPRAEQIAGLGGAVLLGALTLRVLVVFGSATVRRRRARRRHLSSLRIAATRRPDDPRTWWLEHPYPVAFSLAGHPGVVVASDGLRDRLSDREVSAVLAHEYAHLRGRHHLLIAWFDALARALPFVPLFREAPQVVRGLAEQSADACAARTYGPDVVCSALVAMAGSKFCAPGDALAMAQGSVDGRIDRLTRGYSDRGPVWRSVHFGAVGALVAVAPVVAAGLALSALAVLSCPLSG